MVVRGINALGDMNYLQSEREEGRTSEVLADEKVCPLAGVNFGD